MTIFFWGVIISVLIYLVVGLLAGRRVKDTSDYYVCGRNAPTLLITGTLFASMLSVSGLQETRAGVTAAISHHWCFSMPSAHAAMYSVPWYSDDTFAARKVSTMPE